MNYNVRLILDNDNCSEFKGYVLAEGLGKFEGSLDLGTFSHDLFEHWFENTKFFKTKELSHAGECVAMGIRSYLDDKSGIVKDYMNYNIFRGVEWNSWSTCISQIAEAVDIKKQESEDVYSLDFDYTYLKGWEPVNNFEGYCNSYNQYYCDLGGLEDKIEIAFSYGYWLGEKIFKDKIDVIDSFLENLKDFLSDLKSLGFGEDPYEGLPWYFPNVVDTSVRKNSIRMKFGDDLITDKGIFLKKDSPFN